MNKLLVLAALVLAGSAHAETYSMDLRVEATESTCQAQKASIERTILDSAAAIGKDLADVRVSCLGEFEGATASGSAYRAYQVSVRYQVKGWPQVYTANWGVGSLRSDTGRDKGVYPSLDLCIDARQGELAAFTRATGIQPRFWACMSDQVGTAYVFTVTAFGKPKAELFALNLDSALGVARTLNADEQKWVKQMILFDGGELRAVNQNHYLYFADSRIVIQAENVGHWYEVSHCQKQLADASALFVGRPFTLICESQEIDADLSWVSLRALTVGDRLFLRDFGAMSAKYPSFDSCRQYLPEIVASESEAHGTNFLGALCIPEGRDSSRFVIEKWSRL